MPRSFEMECPHCLSQIRLLEGSTGARVSCPGCQRQVQVEAAVPNRLWQRRQLLWWTVAGLTILALGVLGLCYRRFLLSGLDLIGEATGGRKTAALALVLTVIALSWVLFVMAFPVLVYFSLRDLRRRTGELEKATRLCVRHLGKLSADRERDPAALPPGTSLPKGDGTA